MNRKFVNRKFHDLIALRVFSTLRLNLQHSRVWSNRKSINVHSICSFKMFVQVLGWKLCKSICCGATELLCLVGDCNSSHFSVNMDYDLEMFVQPRALKFNSFTALADIFTPSHTSKQPLASPRMIEKQIMIMENFHSLIMKLIIEVGISQVQ